MARLSLVAFLALAFSGVALATSPDSQEVVADDGVKATASWSYSVCGGPEDIVTINSLVVSPDPPEPGKQLTVTVNASTTEVIQDGAYAHVVVKLGLVKLLTKRFDICEEARKANATVQCPVDEGEYIIEQTVELPKEIPRAKFNVEIHGYTAEDEDMLCLKLVVDFMKRFPYFW